MAETGDTDVEFSPCMLRLLQGLIRHGTGFRGQIDRFHCHDCRIIHRLLDDDRLGEAFSVWFCEVRPEDPSAEHLEHVFNWEFEGKWPDLLSWAQWCYRPQLSYLTGGMLPYFDLLGFIREEVVGRHDIWIATADDGDLLIFRNPSSYSPQLVRTGQPPFALYVGEIGEAGRLVSNDRRVPRTTHSGGLFRRPHPRA